MKARANQLVGRTITQVVFYPFPDGRGGTAHQPVLTLDNGRRVCFHVEETDVGEYGVLITIWGKSKRTGGRAK
jgi:hypothetical protein